LRAILESERADVLNQRCASMANLESILLGEPSQNSFATESALLGSADQAE
jgi:hypothetical protein